MMVISRRLMIPCLACGLFVVHGLRPAQGKAATTTKSAAKSATPGATHTASATSSTHRLGSGTAHHKRTASKAGAARSSSAHKTATVSRKGKGRKAKPKRSTAYTRLARMQMDPGRVESIQQALITAGTFHGTPTGRWDSDTRDAMARYQAANGFGVTGLPDAKSLMKMGLGPHPLPPQLNKAPDAAGAQPDASAGTPAPALPPSPANKTTPDAAAAAAAPQSSQNHR